MQGLSALLPGCAGAPERRPDRAGVRPELGGDHLDLSSGIIVSGRRAPGAAGSMISLTASADPAADDDPLRARR